MSTAGAWVRSSSAAARPACSRPRPWAASSKGWKAQGRLRRRHRDHPGSQPRHLRTGQVRRLPAPRHQSPVHRRAELPGRQAAGPGAHPRRRRGRARRRHGAPRRLRQLQPRPDARPARAEPRRRPGRPAPGPRPGPHAPLLVPTDHGAEHGVLEPAAGAARGRHPLGHPGGRPGPARRGGLPAVRDLRLRPRRPARPAQPELLELRRLPRHRRRRPRQAERPGRAHPAHLEDPPAEGLPQPGEGLPGRRARPGSGRPALRVHDERPAPDRRRPRGNLRPAHRPAAGGHRGCLPAAARKDGLLLDDPNRLAPTERGQLFLNDLLQHFLPE